MQIWPVSEDTRDREMGKLANSGLKENNAYRYSATDSSTTEENLLETTAKRRLDSF